MEDKSLKIVNKRSNIIKISKINEYSYLYPEYQVSDGNKEISLLNLITAIVLLKEFIVWIYQRNKLIGSWNFVNKKI